MIINQLTIHIEDRCGASWQVFQTLADKGINILSYSINDEPEYGVLRLIVDNVKLAAEALKQQNNSYKNIRNHSLEEARITLQQL